VSELEVAIADLDRLAKARSTPPDQFARAVARCGGLIAARGGNRYLARLLRHQLDHTLWGLIWRERPLDFFTPRRQLSAVQEWKNLARALAVGQDVAAEYALRSIFFNARDAAIATLQKTRSERIDRAHLIRDER
jgi:hypothetical protein